jgi:hypothetical protein
MWTRFRVRLRLTLVATSVEFIPLPQQKTESRILP